MRLIAIASQMASANIERTTVTLRDPTGKHELRATGQVVKFPGFLAVYDETLDQKPGDEEDESGMLPVLVKGENDVLFVLAQCCRPVPGDEIVGYVTRGRGISVHATDCPNVRNLLYNPEREIDVAWAADRVDLYSVSLILATEDRQGMLARLTDTIARQDTNIRQIEADTDRPGRGNIVVVVDVRDRAHLERVRQALRDLPGVLDVNRKMTGAIARPQSAP